MSAAVGGSNSADGTGTGRVVVLRARVNGPDCAGDAGAAGAPERDARKLVLGIAGVVAGGGGAEIGVDSGPVAVASRRACGSPRAEDRARVGVEAGEDTGRAAHGHPAPLGLPDRRDAGLLEPRLLGEDLLQRRLGLRRQLVEAHAHPGRDVLARRIVLADPDDRPFAGQQRRRVLKLKLEPAGGVSTGSGSRVRMKIPPRLTSTA